MFNKIIKLKNHEGFKKYLKNTSWLFLEKIFRIFAEVFVGIWIARYLGPNDFGLLNYAISFTVLFGALSTLGLDGIVIREIINSPKLTDRILGSAFFLKLTGSLIALFLLFISIKYTSNDNFTNLLIFIIASSLIFKSFNVIDMYFQSKVLSKYVALSNSFALILASIIRVFLILNNSSLISFGYVFVFEALVMMSGYLYFYFKMGNSLTSWKFDISLAKELLKNSWPLMLSSIAIILYMKIDQIMIKEMMNNESVGQYAAAVRLSEAWYFIPVIITASLYPAILNAKKIDEFLYYNRLQKLYDLMVLLGISVAIITSFYSEFIISLLYGNDYIQAANILTIHIWTGISVALGVASGKWILSENLQIISMIRSVSGAILNIVLNYFFIKIWGIKGAAISTLISYLYINNLSLIFFKKTRICFKQQLKSLNLINSFKRVFIYE